jgi:hypothetical protein
MITTVESITTAAAALFVSTVSIFDDLTDAQVSAAIDDALRTHGGSTGCTADVAQAYGDHPELAAPRMRWARRLAEQLYTPRLALAA